MIKRETYEWDEDKALANLAKHDVDFTAAYDLEWDATLTIDQTRDGEERHLYLRAHRRASLRDGLDGARGPDSHHLVAPRKQERNKSL